MPKADLIRQYHTDYPELKPTELARRIEHDHKGVKVTVQDVSGTLANGEGAITTPFGGSAILGSRRPSSFPEETTGWATSVSTSG
jgi:hypothetical protein